MSPPPYSTHPGVINPLLPTSKMTHSQEGVNNSPPQTPYVASLRGAQTPIKG